MTVTQPDKTKSAPINAPTDSGSMPIETLEFWSSWTAFGAAVVGGLAALLVLVAWFFSHQLGKAKTDEMNALRTEAAKANERAGALELETARQQERAAIAEHTLAELRRKSLPRGLDPDRTAALIEALRWAEPKAAIRVDSVLGNEPFGLATQFVGALREAGWVVEVTSFQQTPANPIGYGIAVQSEKAPNPVAQALHDAFKRADIAMSYFEDAGLASDEVRIVIGVKE